MSEEIINNNNNNNNNNCDSESVCSSISNNSESTANSIKSQSPIKIKSNLSNYHSKMNSLHITTQGHTIPKLPHFIGKSLTGLIGSEGSSSGLISWATNNYSLEKLH